MRRTMLKSLPLAALVYLMAGERAFGK